MRKKSKNENDLAPGAYELGTLVGRHEAFGLIASRCSAANAATLLRIREKKLWRGHASTWSEFCENRLRISHSQANRLIQLLQEFGEAYFNVARAVPISAATYRAIAPAVHDNALHLDGEAIALTEENAPRIAAAVDALRKTITLHAVEAGTVPAGENPESALEAIERQCTDLLDKICGIAHEASARPGANARLRSAAVQVRACLAELDARIRAAEA